MSVRNPLSGVPIRAARWSALHPWRAILTWLVFVLVAVGLAIAVPTAETTGADYRLGDSGRADAMVHAAGLEAPATENILITAPAGSALDARAADSAVTDLADQLVTLEGVDHVSKAQWSPDRSALLVSAQLAKDQEDAAPARCSRRQVIGLAARTKGLAPQEDLRTCQDFGGPGAEQLRQSGPGRVVA